MAASYFATEFGEKELGVEYREGAIKIKAALEKYLYLPKEKRFARMATFDREGKATLDPALDASLYGLVAFGVYEPKDPKVVSTMEQIFSTLEVNGGIIRYENDSYYRENEGARSNPWFVTTLWKAQYLIASSANKSDLQAPLDLWVARGILG